MKKITSLLIVAVTLMLTLASCSDSYRTKITEEEWNALGSIMNYTIKITGKDTEKISGVYYTSDFSETVKATQNAEYHMLKYLDDGTTNEYYYFSENGETYSLRKSDDGTWNAKAKQRGPYSLLEYATPGKVEFDDLTYNIFEKSYSYTSSENGTVSYQFYFKDGALVKFDFRESDAYYVWTGTAEVSGVGTTSVTLPEYTVKE